MGRQESLIQLNGSVGNVSFYKSKVDGYLARKKGGLSKSRIESDPAYQRTRENMAEFARAGLASQLLRRAFRGLLLGVADKRMTGRLTREMVKVIHEDAVNSRGLRNVIDGEATLLEGFQFNRNGSLKDTLSVDVTASIDRSTGTMVVNIPEFIPANTVLVPDGATHFRFRAGGGALDFAGSTYSVATVDSALIAITREVQGPSQLNVGIAPASEHPLFLIFGIEFLQVVKNGEQYPLNNGTFNAMAIVKVDGGV